MKFKHSLLLAAGIVACATLAQAAATPEEIKQLGTTLTPWGAEVAASKDGAVAAYTGGIKAPANFNKKSGKWPDPYPNDKPLFSINKGNVAQYAGKLTPGAVEMINRHDTFRVDVYPSRRGYFLSKASIDATLKNAANPECKLVNDNLTMQGCWGGVAFPLPKNAYEVLWNYLTLQRADGDYLSQNYLINSSGGRTLLIDGFVFIEYPFHNGREKPYTGPGQYFKRLVSETVAPSRDAGNINTNWYPLDYKGNSQRTWSYTPGQRRVRMAPEFTYDTPIASLGAGMFFDEIGLFTGKMDRHDYKLLGKREMIVPYNNYRLTATPVDVSAGPKHVNPDVYRWETHRVWVIEATVKQGVRHAAAKRYFYVDEDSYAIVASEAYDASGKMFRTMFSSVSTDYANGSSIDFSSGLVAYDLTKGFYLLMGVTADKHLGIFTDVPPHAAGDYTPEGLIAKGVR